MCRKGRKVFLPVGMNHVLEEYRQSSEERLCLSFKTLYTRISLVIVAINLNKNSTITLE